MLSVLIVILPIFALILTGWLARRLGLLGPHATQELNRFVVYLALPALLLDIVANACWADIWQPGFIAAFGLGIAIVFALTVGFRLWRRRALADAAVDGLNAAYGNTGYMGFPLALAAAGSAALAPTLTATILTVCILFAIALILIELGLQTERNPRRLAGKVILSLTRNPLLVAPVLGGLLLTFHIRIPAPAETFLTLLRAAASPCALITLGLFLAEKREEARPDSVTIGVLVVLKLLVQPLVTGILAVWVFRLQPAPAHLAILIAALPTGTGPFMLAEFYGREAAITSRVILISTIASLITMTAYLALVR